MDFTRNQAKTLANAKELELFDTARKPNLTKHTKAELKRLVKRSRTLRDRLKDVKRKQVRSKQSEKGSRGAEASDRSQEKALMFSQVHDILTERLAFVEDKENKEKEKLKAQKEKKASAAAKAKEKTSPAAKKTKPAAGKETKKSSPKAKENQSAAGKEVKKASTEPKKTKSAVDKETAKATKQAVKKSLASLSSQSKPADEPQQSASDKATFASKAAIDPMVDADKSLQAKARKGSFKAEIIQKRIDKSGMPQQQSHMSSLNKRKQGKKDSR